MCIRDRPRCLRQGCGHSRLTASAAPGPAGRVPCAPRNPGRLRCRRPGAFAPEPQGFSPVRRLRRRTSPALLRCSAPQRRSSGCARSLAGGTEAVRGWKSTVVVGRAGAGLRGGAYAAPRSAARRGKSARRADRARSLEVLPRRRQDGGIAAAPACEHRREPGPQGQAPHRSRRGGPPRPCLLGQRMCEQQTISKTASSPMLPYSPTNPFRMAYTVSSALFCSPSFSSTRAR